MGLDGGGGGGGGGVFCVDGVKKYITKNNRIGTYHPEACMPTLQNRRVIFHSKVRNS